MDDAQHTMKEYVKSVLPPSGSHGFDHTARVTCLCEMIGSNEHADMDVLIPAALFHDIARPVEEEKGIPHEEEGARMAGDFLRSIHYDEKLIPRIADAILTHRYTSGKKPESLEAKILSDADKLDAMGAIGISRTFIQAGEQKGEISDGISHMGEKLLKLKDLMYTGCARQIAGQRHEFLLLFMATYNGEISPGQEIS
jgi:uncharacterized protein